MEEIDARIFLFVTRLNEKYGDRYEYTAPKKGIKYTRVVQEANLGAHRSVHCFIERETGKIYKSASWKAPAKHARGNIWDDDFGLSGVNEFGANYLR